MLRTIDRVEDRGLAERLLVLCRRIAAIVTVLTPTNAVISVSLIWLLREVSSPDKKEREKETNEVVPVEVLGSEGRECTRSGGGTGGGGGGGCGCLRTSELWRRDKRKGHQKNKGRHGG